MGAACSASNPDGAVVFGDDPTADPQSHPGTVPPLGSEEVSLRNPTVLTPSSANGRWGTFYCWPFLEGDLRELAIWD